MTKTFTWGEFRNKQELPRILCPEFATLLNSASEHISTSVIKRVAEQVCSKMVEEHIDQESLALLRSLDHRARRILGLFSTQETIQSSDVAGLLGIFFRQARNLLTGWVEDGWLEV